MRNREITMGNRKMRKRKLCSVLGVAAAAAALIAMPMPKWASAVSSASAAEEGYELYGHVTNPGLPLLSFDISWADSNNRLFFLADRTNGSVDILPMGPNPVGLPILSWNRLVPPSPNAFAGTGGSGPGSCGTNCAGPNGVVTFTNPKSGTPELWVGDGPTANSACGGGVCSTLKVFTVAGGTTPTHVISTGGVFRADELCFGTFSSSNDSLGAVHGFVAITNPADSPPFVSIIDTDTYKVVTHIAFDGNSGGTGASGPNATNGIEQCQFANNRFIINVPEVGGTPGDDTSSPGAVVTIDPTSSSSGFPVTGVHSVDLSQCAGPQGMAVGPSHQVLLGCNAVSPTSAGGNGLQNSVIVRYVTEDNTNDAVVENTFADSGGADEVWYNPGNGHYFIAQGSHNPELLGVIDSQSSSYGTLDGDVFIGGNTTAPNGSRQHSVAADAVTNLVGVPISAIVPNPTFTSTLCGSSAAQAQGCLAIIGPNLFDNEEALGTEPSVNGGP